MAKVFLETGDDYRVVNDNTTVYGVAGDDTDSVIIESDATDVTVNANVDRVDFAGSIADFTFQTVFGANLLVYAADGTTLIASIPLQEDADGTQLVFSDGAIDAIYDGTVTAGGIAITDTAAAITPDAADIDDTTTTEADVEPVITNPQLSVSTADVAEGETATFTVMLDEVQTEEVTVDYTISYEGDASADDIDAVDMTGTLTIAAGDTTATVEVPVVADTLSPEEGEGITLTLANATGADTEIDVDAATANITDVPVTYTLTQNTDEPQEGDTITYTLTASAAASEDIDVDFSVVPGDATADDQGTNDTNLNDFSQGSFNPSTVTLAAGETSVTFALDTENDGITELPENFDLQAEIAGEVVDTLTTTLLDGPQGGETFELTGGVDSGPDFVGTGSDDTYVGTSTTFTTGDDLDGNDGSDTLNLTFSDDTVAPVVDIANIEIVNIRNADATPGGLALDGSGWSGVETLTMNRPVAAGSTVAVSNLTAVPTIGVVQGAASTFEVDFDGTAVDLTGTSDAVSISLDRANLAALEIGTGTATPESFEILNFTNTGASQIDSLADNDTDGAVQLTPSSMTFTGSGSVDLNAVAYAGLTDVSSTGVALDLDIDNSGAADSTATTITSTGDDDDITLTSGANATATVAAVNTINVGDGDNTVTVTAIGDDLQELAITTGSGEDTIVADVSGAATNGSTASIITGAGADDVTYTSDANVALTLDLGAGDDVFTTDDVLAATANTDADVLDGGDGIDTLRGLSADMNAIGADTDKIATLSNFEQLAITDALANAQDLSALGFDQINLEVGALSAGTITLDSGGTIRYDQAIAVGANVTSGAVIANVSGASNAGSFDDVLNLEIDADFDEGGADVFTADVAVDFVETLNIKATATDEAGNDNGTVENGANYVVSIEDGDRLETITVDTDLATTVQEDTTNFTALNVFNAGASTAGVTVDVTNATQGVVMTGGTGDDNFTGSGFADEVVLGDGDNTYMASVGADNVTLGNGANNLDYSAAADDSVEGAMDTITGFNAVLDADNVDTLTTISGALDVDSAANTDVSAADVDAGTVTANITDGIIELDGADAANIDTIGEWIDVAEIMVAVDGGGAAAAGVVAFEFDGSTYVVDAGVDDAIDNIVQLVGVTGVDALALAAADDSILIA